MHTTPEARGHGRLAWVDANVMIRPEASDIFAAVPRGKLGAVDDFVTPTKTDHDLVMEQLYRRWDCEASKHTSNCTTSEYYANYGIECSFDSVVQTGVMVYEPTLHGPLFEMVYRSYEEGIDCSLNHEMRLLSHELLEADVVHWLDAKFNMQWSYYRELNYRFLDEKALFPLPAIVGDRLRNLVRVKCVAAAYRNNYFLHFAGRSRDYLCLEAN